MLSLGKKVRLKGQAGMVIARTLSGEPTYDVRLADGSLVRYIRESELELQPAEPSERDREP